MIWLEDENVTGASRREMGRDLRTGGAWSPAQHLKNGAIFGAATLALALSRALALRSLRTAGRALGAAAHALAGKARRTALSNVALVYPEMSDGERRALVRRTFMTMGELLADAVALLRPAPEIGALLELTPAARDVIDDATREGRGVLFASAHLGPWERVAASLVAAGVPFAALARESYDPRFSRLYEKLRGARGVPVVWRSGANASAPLAGAAAILRALRRGAVLGVPMDLRSRVASCEVPFLGHPASTPVGPARIALRARAAVIVGTVAPGPPGAAPFVITATRIPTDGLDVPAATADPSRSAIALTERINLELSSRIRALPHAWVWMHERWAAPDAYGGRLTRESLG
jgi:Kdo2-lipid IVA lauroyltransferase/acyltransferase